MSKALRQLGPHKLKIHEEIASREPWFQKGLNKPPVKWDGPSQLIFLARDANC